MTSSFAIRPERQDDAGTIRAVIHAAFENAPHTSGTEAAIVEALRASGALTISLVAAPNDEIIGHIAFSPVTVDGRRIGWFGLGPVAVRPDRQRHGAGYALIQRGLQLLSAAGAKGCVVLGDPTYYQRFGFRNDPDLCYPGAPPQFFHALSFDERKQTGEVAYHSAFDTRA